VINYPQGMPFDESADKEELYALVLHVQNAIQNNGTPSPTNWKNDNCGAGTVTCDSSVIVVKDTDDLLSLPFVILDDDRIIGKFDLLKAIYKSCPDWNRNHNNYNTPTTATNHSNTTNDVDCTCTNCVPIRKWVKPSIPSRLLRFQSNVDQQLLLWVRCASYATKNYIHFIRNNHNNNSNTITILNNTKENTNDIRDKQSWMGPWVVQIGDLLRFLVVSEHTDNKSISSSPLEFRICRIKRRCDYNSFDAINQSVSIEGDVRQTSLGCNIVNEYDTTGNDSESVQHNAYDDSQPLASQTSQIVTPHMSNILKAIKSGVTNVDSHTSFLTLSPDIAKSLPIDEIQDSASKSPLQKIELTITTSNDKYVLYFVEKGTDMHRKTHIEVLRKNAERRGAVVLDTFNKLQPPWPTHFVISQKVSSVDSVATSLGFDDLEEMSDFISEHNIVCATRDWASQLDDGIYQKPTLIEQIPGFRSKKRKFDNKHIENEITIEEIKQRNLELSELFRTLAKLHQDCPLYANDDWKAYMFQLVSGRIKHLDFEVTNDPNILQRLRNISGFGASTMQIIEEFLETGASSRVKEFETDKQRVAMNVMMNIWGVGRVRATELVNAGYTRIGAVRQAVANGTLHLDRNQFIGLECYEDIMERMPRYECELIADIIKAYVHRKYPSAEIVIMGSYRRGKLTCGDVDILVTHPDYFETVPTNALGEIVDDLCASGHVAYHLTFISGMKPEAYETLPKSVANHLTRPSSYGRTTEKKDKYTMSSWMGVLNSPSIPGKRRRVDIKFYPYSERYFASLYFTGNGHFNRSMRLWATRKFNYMLSDHGIVDKSTGKPIIKNPSSENDIFDVLGLKWKETTERDCFDDVEPFEEIAKTTSSTTQEWTREEIIRDGSEHIWID
jgi:DNA polymerase/3'-5' exonuclease PolX